MGFDPHAEIKYLIFSFMRIGFEARRGVDFRHSARNVSRIPISGRA